MPSKRHALAALALAVLAVTAGCAGVLGTASTGDAPPASQISPNGEASTGDAPSGNSIAVGARGESTSEPDRAVLHVAVTATADSAEEARSDVAENVSALRSALADAGIDEENVTTEHYNIHSQTGERRPAGEIGDGAESYRAIHALSIEIGDVERVGEIIELAVSSGADDVRHVEYTLSEESRAELREEALRAAMENARVDADVLADSANLEIGGVHSVSTGGADVRPYRAELTAAAGSAGDSSTSIDSGPVTVIATVDVVYDATAADQS